MAHQKGERTFVLIKHDAIQRGLIGEIMRRIERTGLKTVAMKMFVPERDQVIKHYNKDDAWFEVKGKMAIENLKARGEEPAKSAIDYGKDLIEGTVSFLTCGPAVAVVFEGSQAIGIVKKLVGSTEPLTADVGTIRSDYTTDSYPLANEGGRAVRNLIHCTDPDDGQEEADREISVWFSDNEIMKYTHINEKMLHDVNLDGILE